MNLFFTLSLEEIKKIREKKLSNIRKAGFDPYPAEVFRSHKISELKENFDKFENKKKNISVVGRLMSIREHGGSAFADLKDGSGKIQIFFKKDVLGEKNFNFFIENFDIGDFIQATGIAFKTKRGEPTLEVKDFKILAKSLLPLPEKWHGLQDVEERYRKRYLDLLFNESVKEKFLLRSKIIEKIRGYFLKQKCIEVETPILQTIPGGALAKPFKTHLNTLDLDLYLRIAPELYLKRLLIGGFEKIFEMGRNFRNEGIDREHNPEFTMLEAYFAYRDYIWLMDFVENLFEYLVKEVFGKTKVKYKDDYIEFKKPYKRIEFNELLKKYTKLDYDKNSEKDFVKFAKEVGLKIEKGMTKANIADELFKKLIRSNIINPVFVINHPVDLSPLSKRLGEDMHHVARFQLLIGGFELVNAFSELNDPIDQKERFEEQKKLKGDVHPYDKEFIEALEYGMPPAAGMGLGIDRLIALLTNSHSLREVILFPTMKPK